MPSRFDARGAREIVRPETDEGSRLRRNVVSFAAFLIAPLQMSLLSRALGADGFGRWWWTFVVLELAGMLGMQGADLYVRRELPRRGGDRDAMHCTVGSALAVAGSLGLALCLLQMATAHAIASSQHDPALATYLAVLALQPLLANVGAVLAAALQSVNAYGGIAFLRGLLAPLLQVTFLGCAWLQGVGVLSVLIGLVCVNVVTLFLAALLYLRHFSLRSTLSAVRACQEVRAVLSFGAPLLLPNALWTVGAKIDLYLLRPHVGPAALGIYAACLQLASVLPSLRLVFDPVVQAQIAALQQARVALGESLQRLSRLCALVLLPFFVGLVALGEPTLSLLLGRPAPDAALPLIILSVGQLFGSIAVASWLVPMLLPGRALSMLAALTLLLKSVLLLLLAPRLGLLGAAIATSVGTVLAQQGMARMGSRMLGVRVSSHKLWLVCAATLAVGSISVAARHSLVESDALLAFWAIAAAAGALSLLALLMLLDAGERAWLSERLWPRRAVR